MFFFAQCDVCTKTILVGWRREGERRFCSSACQAYARHPGFCAACLAQTTEESAGAHSINLVGTTFFGSWNRCATCGSTESIKAVMILVPVFPLARYRLIRFPTTLGAHALLHSRRIPGPAMTRQIWVSLAWATLVAIGLWAAFIGAIVYSSEH